MGDRDGRIWDDGKIEFEGGSVVLPFRRVFVVARP